MCDETPAEELVRRIKRLKLRGGVCHPTFRGDILSIGKIEAYFRAISLTIYLDGKRVYSKFDGDAPFIVPARVALCLSYLRAAMILEDLADV